MEFYALWDNMWDDWDRPWGYGMGPALYPTEEMARKKRGERTHGKYYIIRHKEGWIRLAKPREGAIEWYDIRKVTLLPV